MQKAEFDVINSLYLLSCENRSTVQKIFSDFFLLVCMNYLDGKKSTTIPGIGELVISYEGDEITPKGKQAKCSASINFSKDFLRIVGQVEDLKNNKTDDTDISNMLLSKIKGSFRDKIEDKEESTK